MLVVWHFAVISLVMLQQSFKFSVLWANHSFCLSVNILFVAVLWTERTEIPH